MKKILNFEQIDNLVDELSEKILKDYKFKSIALIGDLGVGKTYISKRICKNLGVKGNVKSPTFTYLLEYDLGDRKVVHFDLYRLSNIDELYEIGYEDYIEDGNIFLIEWANNVPEAIPENTLYFSLEHNDETSRIVSVYEIKDGEVIYVDINNYNFN
ncbi:tRNA (adenosine(37)-N6)-threonylcarbamoyltransferase complex ATPase subunit type 1 TsaE [Streptobacillus felis]|uniref:tRNA threonylcarbamoyladenosine biosynthesis protein TsaE n=1 Tax=Streptobacillus felis TaxID=1384509 RepID=A0A7Z0T8B9_9FUSO|nr:tRNA (adenosine(37)-N6)-threonylcarbamoyltransferase complex ATPase subunit type 1 TsaE [Streptobacillus felis]NYV27799.1 tRNA (adenosine(37)-N6)-threonylcarbamoyltransferase complex ATPase subunit type 1 TsaE [Streptobacillus felis]